MKNTDKFYIKALEMLDEIKENAEKEYDLQKSIGDISLRSTVILSWYEGQAWGIIYSISNLDISNVNTKILYEKYIDAIRKMQWDVTTNK